MTEPRPSRKLGLVIALAGGLVGIAVVQGILLLRRYDTTIRELIINRFSARRTNRRSLST